MPYSEIQSTTIVGFMPAKPPKPSCCSDRSKLCLACARLAIDSTQAAPDVHNCNSGDIVTATGGCTNHEPVEEILPLPKMI